MGYDMIFQVRSFVLEMNSTSLVKNSFKDNNKIVNNLKKYIYIERYRSKIYASISFLYIKFMK